MTYLKTATQQAMRRITLRNLYEQMKEFADRNPFHPGVDDIGKYGRWLELDECKLKIHFTRTIIGERELYQFSMGHESGDPAAIPPTVMLLLKNAFMPDGVPLPSMLGNTFQWVKNASND